MFMLEFEFKQGERASPLCRMRLRDEERGIIDRSISLLSVEEQGTKEERATLDMIGLDR